MTTAEHIVLALFGILILGSVSYLFYRHSKILHLFKQQHTMATFTDLQTSLTGVTNAFGTLQAAITNLQAANAGNITPAEADTIATGLNTLAEQITTLATTITPPAPAA